MTRQSLYIENLCKSFPKSDGTMTPVLDDIALEIAPGELVTIIGASGCGKSTVLRLVAGLEQPDAGVIRIGQDPISRPGSDRGMIFQHYTLYPWLTVLDNVMFSRNLKVNRDQLARAEDLSGLVDRGHALIEMLGLSDYESAYPNQLSGGMQQRVAIARALLSSPRVLLMDEPFGALDAQTRELMHDIVLHLFEVEDTTVLFVTHDVEEAIYLGDRVVVLAPHPGRIDGVHSMPWPEQREQSLKLDPEFTRIKGELHDRIKATSTMDADLSLLERMTRSKRKKVAS